MDNHDLFKRFQELSTPQIVDACIRHKQALRIALPGIISLIPGSMMAGRAVPVRHYGSVDVFLEAIGRAKAGDVLVIDNGGRSDEGCVGDLTAVEAMAAGLAGIVLWGSHRDTVELAHIGLPLFSYGAYPAGPLRGDEREPEVFSSARFGDFLITAQDAVFADDDGVAFVSHQNIAQLLATALEIRDTERRQAELVHDGTTLREQFQFEEYLRERATDPSYAFRDHLKRIGGAMEE